MHSIAFRPISPLLSKFLYAFAVFNSAISPYLVGVFSRKVIAIFALLYSFVVWIFFFQHSSRSPAIVVFLRSNNNPNHGNHFMRAWLRCKWFPQFCGTRRCWLSAFAAGNSAKKWFEVTFWVNFDSNLLFKKYIFWPIFGGK